MSSQFAINRKATTDFLESRGYDYDTVIEEDDKCLFLSQFSIPSKLSSICVFVNVTSTEIECLGVSGLRASKDVIQNVNEYLALVNCNLRIGKFQLDFNDGEVRFQSILPCSDSQPGIKDIKAVIMCPVVMFDRYGDGLLKCMLGHSDPKTAFEEANA